MLRRKSIKKYINKADWIFVSGTVLILAGYVLLHDLLGGTLFEHNVWDSYTLQALSWREGRLCLAQNYSHLELAFYEGNYYVSFPPLPSVLMLPLTFIFGENTPNNFVMMIITLASAGVARACFKNTGADAVSAAFWAVFFVFGSNMLWMSTMGGVWFMAQGLNLFLCFAAVYCFQKGKNGFSLAMAALAVGCRPFSVCLLIVLFVLIILRDINVKKSMGVKKTATAVYLAANLKYLIVPCLVAAALMFYNYARFNNPLEFGHNYLPEFSKAGNEQFGFKYLPQNFYNLFLRSPKIAKNGRLEFPLFDGFMFYVANPIFLVFFGVIISDIKNKRFNKQKTAVCIGFCLNLFFLMLHKTLGGWQFGARYTVDLLPFVLLYFLLANKTKPTKTQVFLCGFALLVNIYGTLYMWLWA